MKQVQQLNSEFSWGELSIVLMNDTEITKINHEYFGKNHATDVISFIYPPIPPHSFYSGEVLVNIQRALQEGPRNKGIDYEFALYIAHGCHHLSGADDHTKSQRCRMHTVETAWLDKLKPKGLLHKF